MASSFKTGSLSDSSDETDGDHEPSKKARHEPARKWSEPTRKRRLLSQTESSDTDTEHPLKRPKLASQSDGYKKPNAVPKSRNDGDGSGMGSPNKFSHFMPNSSEDDDEEARNSEDGGEANNQLAPGNYSTVSQKLMQSMGYKTGKGLGKHGQGMKEIIPTSKQRGRRGLGLSLDGLEPSTDVVWDFEKEEVDVKEFMDWMPECTEEPPDIKELRQWFVEGKKKTDH